MSLFAERVAGLAMRASAAAARAWRSESVAPKASSLGTAVTRTSALPAAMSMGGSALPVDARPKAITKGSPLPGDARPQGIMTGSPLPIDARPRSLMGGSPLPVDARPKAILTGAAIPRSAVPAVIDWKNKAELAIGLARQEGVAIPVDARPKPVVATTSALPTPSVPKPVVEGSALPRDPRPKLAESTNKAGLAPGVVQQGGSAIPPDVVDEARKQVGLAKAARARQAAAETSHQSQELEL